MDSEDVLSGVRAICEDPRFTQCMYLVKHGIPFDVAFGCDEEWRLAMFFKLQEFDGQKFDFDTLEYVDLLKADQDG